VKPVLLDTSFLVALLNKADTRHSVCAGFHETMDRRLVTCEPVLAESCYLLRSAPAGIDLVLANLEEGIFEIPFRLAASVAQVRSIIEKYKDRPASLADACLVQMADELGTGDILTLDSDFAHYRWRRNRPFNLLIPLSGP
jgi:predicted nucleic acid-binding protein